MRFLLVLILILGGVSHALGQVSPGKAPQESSARAEVEKLIQASGADVAVAFRSLDGAQELFIHPDKEFHAANPIKIPVMIELYAEAQAGKLRLSDTLLVHNRFHLDPKDDSDPDVYKAIGKTMTLRDLCDHMITRNSKLAANLLIEKVGLGQISQRVHALHADGVELRRGFESGQAKDGGPDNTTSARGMMELLWALAKDAAVSPEASQEMVGILARTSPEAIAAGLPPATRTAHETVDVTGTHQEAAIVYGAHSFVLVILVRGITDRNASSALTAQITHALAAGMW